MNKNLILDRGHKVLLAVSMLLPFFVYQYLDYITSYYTGDISEQLDIYGGVGIGMMPFLTLGFGLLLYSFIQTFRESEYNNYKFEKKLQSFLNNKFKINCKPWIYYMVIIALSGVMYAAVVDSIVSVANNAKLYSEYNALTLERNGYYGHSIYMAKLFGGLIIALTLLAALVRPDKLNKKFLFGFFVLPLLFANTINFTSFAYFSEIPSYFNATDVLPYIPYLDLLLQAIGWICLILLTLTYFIKEILKKKNSFIEAVKNLKFVLIGYLSTFLSGIIVATYLVYSPTVEHFENDPNIMTVEVYGKEYQINQTLLAVQESRETEYLIEGFVGLGMHNTHNSLDYLLHDQYSLDKEKPMKFIADMLLINLRHQEARSDRVIEILGNERMSLSTSMNFLIPIIIYESSPLHHQERALEAVIDGRYQDVIDYYLEDAVNRKDIEKLPLGFKVHDSNERVGSFGHILLQGIVSTLVKKELAILDYSNVNEDKREKLRKIIEDYEPSAYDPPSDEIIESWYQIFNVDRLMK